MRHGADGGHEVAPPVIAVRRIAAPGSGRLASDLGRRLVATRLRNTAAMDVSVRAAADHARDVAGADALAGAMTQQRADRRFDADVAFVVGRSSPPFVAPFAESDLGRLHARSGVLGVRAHEATGGHQFVDEFLPQLRRDAGVGRAPASTVHDDVATVRGALGFTHPPTVTAHAAACPPEHV